MSVTTYLMSFNFMITLKLINLNHEARSCMKLGHTPKISQFSPKKAPKNRFPHSKSSSHPISLH